MFEQGDPEFADHFIEVFLEEIAGHYRAGRRLRAMKLADFHGSG